MNKLQPTSREIKPQIDKPSVTVNLEGLASQVNSEVSRLEKIDISLGRIEDILLNEVSLKNASTEDLTRIYQLLIQRKTSTQSFVAKLLELGIRSEILSKILNMEVKESEDIKRSVIIPEDARRAADRIRERMRDTNGK